MAGHRGGRVGWDPARAHGVSPSRPSVPGSALDDPSECHSGEISLLSSRPSLSWLRAALMGWRRHALLPAAVTVGVAVMATVPATRQPAPGAHRLHRALLAGSFPSRSSGWGGFEGRAHRRGAWRGEPGAGGALRPLPLGASQPAWGGTQGLSPAGLSQLPPPSGLRRKDPTAKKRLLRG